MTPPVRFNRPPALIFVIILIFAAFFIQGLSSAGISTDRLIRGSSNLGRFLGSAFPPSMARIDVIAKSMWETLNMAVVGVTFGVILSLPMALLCARNTSPHWTVRIVAVNIVSTLRTIPDLIWALIFVVAVGLGPLAGILAIVMDTIGFCARFFAERIEETNPRPGTALRAAGASRGAVVGAAILPECFPSFVATSLFSVEKAVRSAVVLGLVGAGGIGVELTSAMNLFRYNEALTIILVILIVVIAVEQIAQMIRRRII
ncbi:phosphonate ABC transporter, permease protein PhnE [Paracoccus sp. (in: a-proteobacteria)]|uniref:phosphonate ABC transporter, permease protein PhnE n=1 Tax=Paracoccus sp. TaxID=267 RepID=UPI0026E054EC|nr:phosphonate ABC transporter, permease protein PhnE [Paracoccus sp. (in: a-proteobacteria)]MDO5646487.1 phosphonate ABC transporter, permease protein PhnE [Paracoccus sp. (in: a-proteobacteria)]